jgi:solute carrier family 25 folate transporter 32
MLIPGRPEYRIHIASAMTAGVTSAVVTNPIWVVKTRLMVFSNKSSLTLQTQSKATPQHYHSALDCVVRIMKEEGPRTFYSGLLPSLIGVSHVVVQFPALEYLKHVLTPPDWPPHDPLQPNNHKGTLPLPTHRLIIAIIISKALASAATYPHEVLRTRLQNQHGGISRPGAKYKGLWHAFRTVIREEGTRGLYGGFGVNLVRTVPSSLVTILGFEYVRSWLGD